MNASDVPRSFCADRCAAWCQHNRRCNAVTFRSLRVERGEDPESCVWDEGEIKRHRPQEKTRRRAA